MVRCTTLVLSVLVGSLLLPRPAAGEILREWWLGIGGVEVSDLTSHPDYPDNPSGSDLLLSFDSPPDRTAETGPDWLNNYGTRLRGYLQPATSGDYQFWIASDDDSELLLSTDADPANAVLIASVDGWNSHYEWDKYSSQESSLISLAGGQQYYIEALHKEAGGGDHVAVAWQGPDVPVLSVIGGEYLIPFGQSAIVPEPSSFLLWAAGLLGLWIFYRRRG